MALFIGVYEMRSKRITLNEKMRSDIFKAINDPIMELRINLLKQNYSKDQIDNLLFDVTWGAHKAVISVLGVPVVIKGDYE